MVFGDKIVFGEIKMLVKTVFFCESIVLGENIVFGEKIFVVVVENMFFVKKMAQTVFSPKICSTTNHVFTKKNSVFT